jgi:acetyl esterase/lipase
MKVRSLLTQLLLCSCLVSVCGASAVRAQTRPDLSSCASFYITACTDIAYGPQNASKLGSTQRFDLYKPLGAGPFPLIVYVHGGAWIEQDRQLGPLADDWRGVVRQLQRGYAVASVDYRLASDFVRFPAPIHDVMQAIRYLKQNAQTLDIDPKRFALWGHSAGAHIAALIGEVSGKDLFTPRDDYGEYTVPSDVDAGVSLIIGFAGIYDLRVPPPAAVVRGVETLLGCKIPAPDAGVLSPGDCDEPRREAASPAYYATRLAWTPERPRVYLAHGDADSIVRPKQTEDYKSIRELHQLGTSQHLLPGAGHWGYAFRDQLASELDLTLDILVKRVR